MSVEHQPGSQQLATLPETGDTDVTEKMELGVVNPQQLPIETPMDTNDADKSVDIANPTSFTQIGHQPSDETKYTGIKQAKTKSRRASADSSKDGGSVKPLVSTSRPSSAPSFANAPPQSKPVSIFASLFPTNAPTAKATDIPKSRTPTPPSSKSDKELTLPPSSADISCKFSTSQKIVKSEAIADAERSFPDSITAVDEAKTGSTGEILKSVSPVSAQMAPDGNTRDDMTMEKMDADSGHTDIHKLPVTTIATTRAKSSSPNPVADVKNAAKHPPIAGKTIKKEQRKSSPPIPGELKKARRTSPKVKKKRPPPKDDAQDGRNDFYCWVCHKEGEVLCCELCPRVFHAKCLNMTEEPEGDWFCPECEKITDAECKDTQSRAMSMLTIDQFSLLLKYVIQRMKIPLSEPFHEPVDTKMFPDYLDYVFHPMDLSTIERNVKKRKYGCPEAFLSEFKWVVHNCYIYNSPHSKLTQNAKAMLRVAERELNEIELCPECYLNSCRKREHWFCEPCKELHPLVWAKLQGFPHWPAKALRIEKGMVDVRFFGQHDRAWIPLSGCYLISKELPLPVKNKKKSKGPGLRGGLDGAMQEMEAYIENIKKITGEFDYAPPRTLLTHCDLYRKAGSAKTSQSARQQSEGVNKSAGTPPKMDGADIKGKSELKEIGSGKESMRVRTTGSKKGKTVTTSGEHPTRSFGPRKKKASMESLSKTIESCKASLGIEKIQDVKMNSGSDVTSSSSDEEEMDAEVGEEKPGGSEKGEKGITSTSGLTSSKPTADEDDSDAELVIDLGDMEESGHTDTAKSSENTTAKGSDGMMKKRKPEFSSDKPSLSSTKPQLKSILLNASKPTDESERKKMLAKALSEKIGGKRKHDGDVSSLSSNPSIKIRKTIEQHEKLGSSLSDVGQKKIGSKEKEGKKFHPAGKYLEKDISGKIRPGILKSSIIDSGQRKDSYSGEKKMSDTSKHKHKDGSLKYVTKKPLPPDKSGKLDRIPTEADTRKLFNGGRIPRKNPVVPVSDGEEQDHGSNISVMETNQTIEPKKNTTNMPANPRPTRQTGLGRQTSTEHQRKSTDENITLASLKKYSDKVLDTVQKVFYEMYTDMIVPLTSGAGSETSTVASATAMHEVAQMRLELERLKWMHEQEIAELKHNHDLTVAEIRQSLENEKKQLLLEAKVQAEAAKNHAVEETKRKQWCAHCNKEAIFYCCWNTSYCDYPCQQKHWPQHMKSCTQARDSAASGQHAAPEAMMSPPAHSVSATMMNQASPFTNTTSSTHICKPPAMSSVSAGMATITITASPRNLLRLNSTGKSTVLPADSVSSAKPAVVAAAANSTILQLSVASHQQKSGSAISAIGARLLAAKQRSSVKEQSRAQSSQSENASVTSSTAPPESSTDHVITIMESPHSPDAKPSSPKKASLSLSFSEKAQKTSDTVTKKNKADLKQPMQVQTPELCTAGAKSDFQHSMQPSVSESTPTTTASLSDIKATFAKTHSKLTIPSSKAVFSSPPAVVSLIADMGTPLSESSSYSDTPEKKMETPKVQLSLGASAFTRVFADTAKIPARAESTVLDKGSTSPLDPPSGTSAFKPVEMDHANDSSTPKDPASLQVLAPVLADSYLTSSKALPLKTKTPPIEVMEDDPPRPKSQLPRPILPESDEDKSIVSDAKVTDSDTGEPMETDNKA